MSPRHTDGERVGAGRPALTRLLGQAVDSFASQVWAREPLLRTVQQRGGDDFADLFGPDAVDELVSRRGLRTPFLRMAKDGRTLPEPSFTAGGGVGAGIGDQVSEDKVLALFAAGATMVLQGLHRTWGPLGDLSRQLSLDLGHPVQVNAYVTPEQSQGFSDHYDVHDVFVLQVHGQKRWSIREPVLTAPLRDQPWEGRPAQVELAAAGPPLIQETFSPGDCLYLPRGYIHSAAALGGVSIHLTVGIHGWTRSHLTEGLLARAQRVLAGDPEVRGSLPVGPGRDLTADIATAREALVRAVQGVSDQDVADWLLQRERAATRAAPLAPLAQLRAAEGVGPQSTIGLRGHLALTTSEGPDGQVQVRSRAGHFGMPSAHLPVLLRLQEVVQARVADLHPDPSIAVAAASTLLRHGLAVPAPPGRR